MRVTSSVVELQGKSAASRVEVNTASLRSWLGARPQSASTGPRENTGAPPQPSRNEMIGVSPEARQPASDAKASLGAGELQADTPVDDQRSHLNPKLWLLISLVERLSGRRVHLLDASDLGQGSSNDAASSQSASAASSTNSSRDSGAGWGLELTATRTVTESASASFKAEGLVRTADGREIAFAAELSMTHESVSRERVQVLAGNAQAQVKDPLVLNFGGQPVALTAQKQPFDLNSDGKLENIPVLAKGSAMLALDRNANGVVDNGSELFGPTSGDGFAELRALDDDGNGWIDEGDRAFGKLGVWFGGAGAITSLGAASVGAIYLGSAATPFTLRDPTDAIAGQVRVTGVWLGEQGKVGTVQQVDLATA